MTADKKQSIHETINRFEIIKPIISQIIKADDIRSLETETASDNIGILSALDTYSGVDAIAFKHGNMYGIASRICNGNYKTFTIRKERRTTGTQTEFEKKAGRSDGAIFPYYTIQAYFDGSKFQCLAMCYTSELLQYIQQFSSDPHRVTVRTTTDSTGDVDFYIVNWRNYAKWYGEKGFRCYPSNCMQ